MGSTNDATDSFESSLEMENGSYFVSYWIAAVIVSLKFSFNLKNLLIIARRNGGSGYCNWISKRNHHGGSSSIMNFDVWGIRGIWPQLCFLNFIYLQLVFVWKTWCLWIFGSWSIVDTPYIVFYWKIFLGEPSFWFSVFCLLLLCYKTRPENGSHIKIYVKLIKPKIKCIGLNVG